MSEKESEFPSITPWANSWRVALRPGESALIEAAEKLFVYGMTPPGSGPVVGSEYHMALMRAYEPESPVERWEHTRCDPHALRVAHEALAAWDASEERTQRENAGWLRAHRAALTEARERLDAARTHLDHARRMERGALAALAELEGPAGTSA